MSPPQLHPDRVVTFSVAYRPTMPAYRISHKPVQLPIRNVGVFIVTRRNGDDVQFEQYQYAYPNNEASDPMQDMVTLLDQHCDCLAHLPLPRLRHVAVFGPPNKAELERHVLPILNAGP